MTGAVTVVAGIAIPSTSPVFLAAVGVHVLAGLVCVVSGAVAMLSRKRPGRHPTFGTVYFCGIASTGYRVDATQLRNSAGTCDHGVR